MSVNLGTDLSLEAPDCPAVSGVLLVAQDIAARLECPRGALWTDASYGYDVRQHISDSLTDADLPAIAAAVANEVRKDERVKAASAALALEPLSDGKRLLRVSVQFSTADGPFRLVLSVSQLTVTLLGVAPA